MSLEIEVDAFLSDEEIMSWSNLPMTGELRGQLIDPRLIRWLKAHKFDLGEPIFTERQYLDGKGRTRYSQVRAVEKRIVIPVGVANS